MAESPGRAALRIHGQPDRRQHQPGGRAGEDPAQADAITSGLPDGFLTRDPISTLRLSRRERRSVLGAEPGDCRVIRDILRAAPGRPHPSCTGARSAGTSALPGNTRRSTKPASCPGRNPLSRPHPSAGSRERRRYTTPPLSPARTTPHDPPTASPACPAATGMAGRAGPFDTTWPQTMIPNKITSVYATRILQQALRA
jgi:hypothetical protein